MVKLCPICFFVENWNTLCQSSQWHSKMIPQVMKTLVFLVPFILANKPYCPFSEDIYSHDVFLENIDSLSNCHQKVQFYIVKTINTSSHIK